MWEGPVDADQYDGFGHCDMPSSPCRSSLADGRNQGKSVIILIFYYGDFDFSFPFYQEKCMLYPCIHFFCTTAKSKVFPFLAAHVWELDIIKKCKKILAAFFLPKAACLHRAYTRVVVFLFDRTILVAGFDFSKAREKCS